MTKNPLLLFAAIIVGVVGQQALTWLKQHNKKTAHTITRPIVLVYWIALGLFLIIGGAEQLKQNNLLPGTLDCGQLRTVD